MDQFCVPDRLLLPKEIWDIYLTNYRRTYGHLHDFLVNGVTTINRGRGCQRGNGSGRCVYCGIMDLSIKLSSPEKFWADVNLAHEQISADVFYEAFDSLSSVSGRWIPSLIEARPKHLKNKKFIEYAQARDVTEEMIALYKELGVVMVNMGLDSGDDVMLKRLKGPGDSFAANKHAVELINKSGMHVFCSFVLGAPGETKESLENTKKFTKWLSDNKLAAAIEAQPLMPRVGSKVGNFFTDMKLAEETMKKFGLELKNKDLLESVSKSWLNRDIVDTPFMSESYAKIFTDVTYKDLLDAADWIVSYAKNSGLGSGSVDIKSDYVTA